MPDATSTKQNMVVAHFKDGTLEKGTTHDFLPARGSFHLTVSEGEEGGSTREVRLSDLKAVFFVKSLKGREGVHADKSFGDVDPAKLRGLKICVEFADGETLRGVSLGYSKDKPGFFVIPVDPDDNNERIYVVADACSKVLVGAAAVQ